MVRTHYVFNRNIVLCLTDLMSTTYELKFTLSQNKIILLLLLAFMLLLLLLLLLLIIIIIIIINMQHT